MKKIIYIASSLLPLAAWVYAIMDHLSDKEYLMLLISGLIPPIGVIDGIGLFFGFW